MPKKLKLTLVTLISLVGLIIVVSFAFAQWQEPTLPPPEGQVPAPINVGAVNQYKEGYLAIGDTVPHPDAALYARPKQAVPDGHWAGYFDGNVNITGDLNVGGNIIPGINLQSVLDTGHIATGDYGAEGMKVVNTNGIGIYGIGGTYGGYFEGTLGVDVPIGQKFDNSGVAVLRENIPDWEPEHFHHTNTITGVTYGHDEYSGKWWEDSKAWGTLARYEPREDPNDDRAYGVYGKAQNTGPSYGVYGQGSTAGVRGIKDTYQGYLAYANAGVAGYGYDANSIGVYGLVNATSGSNKGVYGRVTGAGAETSYGVYGLASTGGAKYNYGVYGKGVNTESLNALRDKNWDFETISDWLYYDSTDNSATASWWRGGYLDPATNYSTIIPTLSGISGSNSDDPDDDFYLIGSQTGEFSGRPNSLADIHQSVSITGFYTYRITFSYKIIVAGSKHHLNAYADGSPVASWILTSSGMPSGTAEENGWTRASFDFSATVSNIKFEIKADSDAPTTEDVALLLDDISFTGVSYGIGAHGRTNGAYGELGTYRRGIDNITYAGVYGTVTQDVAKTAAVYGYNPKTGTDDYGVYGRANKGIGVYGKGQRAGVYGKDSNNSGYGYVGYGDYGVYGQGTTGVYGKGNIGVYGAAKDSTTSGLVGVQGIAYGANQYAGMFYGNVKMPVGKLYVGGHYASNSCTDNWLCRASCDAQEVAIGGFCQCKDRVHRVGPDPEYNGTKYLCHCDSKGTIEVGAICLRINVTY